MPPHQPSRRLNTGLRTHPEQRFEQGAFAVRLTADGLRSTVRLELLL